MNETTVAARQHATSHRLALARTPGAFVVAIICVLTVLDVLWLVRFRRGYVTEWDESGYLQFALSNFDALRDHGVWTFVKTVGGRGTFGPLLPLVTSLAYPVVGRGIFGSLLVLPLFFAGLIGATFGLARQLVSARWAAVAALAVAAMPAVTDYSRLFHFALPTTACMTAALWALVRSDGLQRSPWAAAFGLFVALTLLSRTMTVAYVPGFLFAAGAQLLVAAPRLRPRVLNLALAAAVAGLVAGPWYIRNARSVYDLLLGSGYGEGATPFGRSYPIASWGYWTKELRLDLSYLQLPLAAALFSCFAVAALFAIMRRSRLRFSRPMGRRAAAIVGLVVVVVEGYLVLTSSRNEGTGFALPWLPALVVLAVAAATSVPTRVVQALLATVLIIVSVAAVASKSGWVAPLATVRTVSVPALGRVTVTDGRGIIQTEVAGGGYAIGPVTQPLPAMHRRWLPLARDVVGWSLRRAEQRHERLHLTLGFDDLIFGNSRLILAAQLWFHRWLPVDYLKSFPDGDTVDAYRRQLLSPTRENALVVAQPRRGATITRSKVEAAARSLGFAPVKAFRLPDNRKAWIWWRR